MIIVKVHSKRKKKTRKNEFLTAQKTRRDVVGHLLRHASCFISLATGLGPRHALQFLQQALTERSQLTYMVARQNRSPSQIGHLKSTHRNVANQRRVFGSATPILERN